MLITKFNKLIRNRFIWGIFAVLISITMVGFFTDLEGCGQTRGAATGAVGTLDGEPVPGRDLLTARFHVILRLRLATGRDFPITPEMESFLNREAWKRLALLRLARRLQVMPSDEELKAAIQREPMFLDNGRFSRNRYQQITAFLAQQFRLSPAHYEAFVREELAIDKIRRAVSAAAWSAPFEIERLARNFADAFTIEFVEVPFITLTRGVTVTDEEVRALFDADPEAFTLPDQVQVAYVEFPFPDFDAADATGPEAVTNYYADNIRSYYTTNVAGEPIVRPIEEVEDEIRSVLAVHARRELAYDAAARFSDTLFNMSDRPDFLAEAAVAVSRPVQVTRFFADDDPPAGLGVGPDFAAAAFALRPEKNANFSEPVLGTNAAFILAYRDTRPARVPAFEEVEDQARARALAEARNTAIGEKSETLEKAIRAALADGATFADAVQQAGLIQKVVSEGPFTAYDAPERLELPRLINAVISSRENETSPFLATDRETLVMLRVVSRMPGDPSALDPIRNQVRSSLNRRHAQLVVGQWEEDLLRQMGWRDPDQALDLELEMDDAG